MNANLQAKPKFTTETPATAGRLEARRNARTIKAKLKSKPRTLRKAGEDRKNGAQKICAKNEGIKD
jgi:hypothetical protein